MNLYELTMQQKSLENLIEEHAAANDGDITDIMPTIDAWATEYDQETKLFGIGCLVRNWEAQAEAQATESKRLADAAKANENRAKRLKEWALYCLTNAGTAKATAGVFTFAVREASQQPLIVRVAPTEIPARFQKIKIEADNSAIRAALKEQDQEAMAIAELGPKTKFLTIK